MPDKIDKELKRKFGAYLKVAILNAKKEYLIELVLCQDLVQVKIRNFSLF